MAILLDQITVGDIRIAVLDSAPDSGAGFVAPVGSLALVQGSAGIYQKANTGDTDWEGATATTEQIQDAVAALLKDSSTIEFSYDDVANELTPSIVAESIDNSLISPTAGIDASKLADGSVSNAELQYINSLASNAQDQLDDLDERIDVIEGDYATQTYVDTTFIPLAQKGAANGVATLDAGGKVPVSQLPNAVMTYEGLWDADQNDPELADGVGNAGMVYRVSVAGSQDLGSGSISFSVGDYAIYSGSIWEKADGTDEVNSVFGRVGVVTAQSGDYTASQVTNVPAGNISSTDVQAAINELDSEKFASADFDSEFDARLATKSTSDLAEGSNLYFTDERAQDAVAAALVDSSSIDFSYDDTANEITAVVLPAGVDHDQLQNFVANEHIDHSAVEILAGAGLSGGGDITATRTISMPDVGTAGTYGSASEVPVFTTDAQGRVSAVTNTSIEITASQVSDFAEAAQDAVGGALTDSATIDFSYDDSGNTISADVIQSGIDHGSISGLGDDDHTQYALLAGRSGGQSLNGGTASSENLSLSSTADATKGKINLGSSSAFDEANDRLGLGTQSPESVLDVTEDSARFNIKGSSVSTVGAVTSAVSSITPEENSVELLKALVTGFNAANNQSVAYERTVRVRNNAGTVTLGTIQSDYTDEGAGLAAANCTFAVNGSDVEVRVSGVAAATLSWKCVLQRVR
jgi:hypothetical protein